MLKVNKLSVAYENKLILKDISFELRAGQITTIIGPNGAGKSTLIRALSGVLPIQNGNLLIKGQSSRELSFAEKARLIAVVPQAIQIPLSFSAWQTVLLGRTPYLNFFGRLSEADENSTRAAMQRTNTYEFKDRLISELSGGEQQRVLLARALNQSAPILLLDEPTAHLDLQYQISLLDQVETLAKKENLSVLIAMHDLNLVSRYADQVLILDKGRIQAQGSVAQVLKSDLLSHVYQIPLDVISLKEFSTPLVVPAENNKNGHKN